MSVFCHWARFLVSRLLLGSELITLSSLKGPVTHPLGEPIFWDCNGGGGELLVTREDDVSIVHSFPG